MDHWVILSLCKHCTVYLWKLRRWGCMKCFFLSMIVSAPRVNIPWASPILWHGYLPNSYTFLRLSITPFPFMPINQSCQIVRSNSHQWVETQSLPALGIRNRGHFGHVCLLDWFGFWGILFTKRNCLASYFHFVHFFVWHRDHFHPTEWHIYPGCTAYSLFYYGSDGQQNTRLNQAGEPMMQSRD